MNIAHLEAKSGKSAEALLSMRLSLRIRADLARGNHGVFWFQDQLSSTYLNIGRLQFDLAEFEGAARSFEQALEIAEPLVGSNPDKPKLARTLGLALYRLGLAREAQGKPGLAAEAMAKAIAHHRSAFARAPEFPELRRYLSDDYHGLARVERILDNHSGAAAAARACLELWPENPDELYLVAREIACCLNQSGERRGQDGAGPVPSTGEGLLADEVIAVLSKAIGVGFRDAARLIQDHCFDPLRSRRDFGEIVATLLDRTFPANAFAR
jgi:tetratricopeptide (TPR) repeat protein